MDTNQLKPTYAARLEIDYPETPDRMTTLFRLLWIIPIAIILGLISGAGETVTNTQWVNQTGEVIKTTRDTAGGLVSGLAVATALMIVFRQRYPRWWFDFSRELARFTARVAAYGTLLTDQYPSTVEEQSVHLDIDYPDVENDLSRWMPLVKWLLAIPHYVVLACLGRRRDVRGDLGLVHHTVHGRVPQNSFRLYRGRHALGAEGTGLCLPIGDR